MFVRNVFGARLQIFAAFDLKPNLRHVRRKREFFPKARKFREKITAGEIFRAQIYFKIKQFACYARRKTDARDFVVTRFFARGFNVAAQRTGEFIKSALQTVGLLDRLRKKQRAHRLQYARLIC